MKIVITFIFVGVATQIRRNLRVCMQTVIKNIMYILRYFDFIFLIQHPIIAKTIDILLHLFVYL